MKTKTNALMMLVLFVSLFFQPAFSQVADDMWFKAAPAVQLSESARMFVFAETKANPAGERSSEPFHIRHLEIPLSAITPDFGLGLSRAVHDSLVFEKNGENFIRWVLNPEDTKFNTALKESLNSRKIKFAEMTHYVGYLTSSRSVLVQDPVTGVIFTVKASTNSTGGSWKDKKETVRAAKAGRMLSDHLVENEKPELHPRLGIIREPLAFYDIASDQAMIIREYDHFNDKSGKTLVPLFSIFHEEFGKKIALQAGEPDIESFWFNTFAFQFAEIFMKMTFQYGIMYNSPHGQNFMVELDATGRPTGKIFVKDYTDGMIYEPVMKAQGGQKIIDHYRGFEKATNGVHSDKVYLAFNPFYSGKVNLPSWIPKEEKWKKAFLDSVKRSLVTKFHFNESVVLGTSPLYHRYWNWEVSNLPKQPAILAHVATLQHERKVRMEDKLHEEARTLAINERARTETFEKQLMSAKTRIEFINAAREVATSLREFSRSTRLELLRSLEAKMLELGLGTASYNNFRAQLGLEMISDVISPVREEFKWGGSCRAVFGF